MTESESNNKEKSNRVLKNLRERQGISSEETNPCLQEHHLSFACLENSGYDHDKCHLEFENYRSCKRFWGSVFVERKRQGIEPYLPPLSERKKIKEDYLQKRREEFEKFERLQKSYYSNRK